MLTGHCHDENLIAIALPCIMSWSEKLISLSLSLSLFHVRHRLKLQVDASVIEYSLDKVYMLFTKDNLSAYRNGK